MKYAIIALLPDAHNGKMDFVGKEFETGEQVGQAVNELEQAYPQWRAITICHIEDLPLLMQDPSYG